MRPMGEKILRQIALVYEWMATVVRYRPAAPSDGFGNITVPLDQLDLKQEQARYATRWWREEEERQFIIGVPSYEHRPALIMIVEAGRNLCGGETRCARKLLLAAARELKP